MEGENTAPEAAAPATEASSTNPTPEPAAPAEATPEQIANYFGTNVDTINDFKKFADSNGKFDKAFETFKSRISNPEPQPAQQQPAPQQQPAAQPATEPQQPAAPTEGHITRDEFFAAQYFNQLASDPKYKDVADKIRNGDALKEMHRFGINPFDEGGINDAKTRQFMDMYAAANAPKQPVAPVTTTPTVDYVDVKEIKSMADVDEIMRQNITLKAQGKPLHPSTEAAKSFGKQYYSTYNKQR